MTISYAPITIKSLKNPLPLLDIIYTKSETEVDPSS